MSARLIGYVSLVGFVLLTGCYRLPKQSGTWIGRVKAQTLYDAQGHSNSCAVFEITSGPALRAPTVMPTNCIMVDRDMMALLPEAVGFTNAKITGTIVSDYAKVPTPGHIIVGPEPEKTWVFPYVIRVKDAEPASGGNR